MAVDGSFAPGQIGTEYSLSDQCQIDLHGIGRLFRPGVTWLNSCVWAHKINSASIRVEFFADRAKDPVATIAQFISLGQHLGHSGKELQPPGFGQGAVVTTCNEC